MSFLLVVHIESQTSLWRALVMASLLSTSAFACCRADRTNRTSFHEASLNGMSRRYAAVLPLRHGRGPVARREVPFR
jgi:hypothetical protein